MKAACKRIQKMLIDIHYSGASIDAVLQHHVDKCTECHDFLEMMNTLPIPEDIAPETEIDHALINGPFRRAEEIMKKRKLMIDLLFYFLGASFYISLIILLASSGMAVSMLIFQLAMFTLGPFALPVILKLNMRDSYE